MRPAKPSAAAAVGRVSNLASGPRIYNLFPLLVGTVSAWRAELPRIAAMNFDWVYVNPFHETGVSGSLYAIKDPFRLDPRFRDAEWRATTTAQIRALRRGRGLHGLKVMTDLVINHTARTRGSSAGAARRLRSATRAGGIRQPLRGRSRRSLDRTVWGDLAELTTTARMPRRFLIGYWDDYVAQPTGARRQRLSLRRRLQGAGRRLAPSDRRRQGARPRLRSSPPRRSAAPSRNARRRPAPASTTCSTASPGGTCKRPGRWSITRRCARSRPRSPSPRTTTCRASRAEARRNDPSALAAHLKARYALAAFFSSGVMMPIGYEWGYRRKLHVVETTPRPRGDRRRHLRLRRRREPLPGPSSGRECRRRAVAALGAGRALSRAAALRCRPPGGGAKRDAELANLTQAPVDDRSRPAPARTGGCLGPFLERTPGVRPPACDFGPSP